MERKEATRKFSPLWIALIIIAILCLVAYSVIFWMPGEEPRGEPVPKPLVGPQ